MEISYPRILLVQALGFLLVLLVFRRFLFKPIMDILEARRAEIDNQYADAENQRKMADELKADYEMRLSGIDEEMRAKITAGRQGGPDDARGNHHRMASQGRSDSRQSPTGNHTRERPRAGRDSRARSPI